MADVELVNLEELAQQLHKIWSRPWWAFWRRRPSVDQMKIKIINMLRGEAEPVRTFGMRIG